MYYYTVRRQDSGEVGLIRGAKLPYPEGSITTVTIR